MRDLILIEGSWGELTVDAMTGIVLFYDPQGADLDDDNMGYIKIYRINLQEYRGYWHEEPKDGDILDYGYWTFDGIYEPPEVSWRVQINP